MGWIRLENASGKLRDDGTLYTNVSNAAVSLEGINEALMIADSTAVRTLELIVQALLKVAKKWFLAIFMRALDISCAFPGNAAGLVENRKVSDIFGPLLQGFSVVSLRMTGAHTRLWHTGDTDFDMSYYECSGSGWFTNVHSVNLFRAYLVRSGDLGAFIFDLSSVEAYFGHLFALQSLKSRQLIKLGKHIMLKVRTPATSSWNMHCGRRP